MFAYCLVAFLITLFVLLYAIRIYNRFQLPKQYNAQQTKKEESKLADPPNKDRYLPSKVNGKQFDTIIIGSGISGLSAASILSRCGQKCLVLEQHDTSGGWTNSFERGGYEFDTGVHFIGDYNLELYDWIAKTPFEWVNLVDGNYKDYCFFDNSFIKIIPQERGKEGYLKMVEKFFPEELEVMKRYFNEIPDALEYFNKSRIIRMIPSKIPLLRKLMKYLLLNKFHGKENIVFQDKLDELKISPKLQQILKQIFCLVGVEANETTYYHHLMMMDYGFNDYFYPSGGSNDFSFKTIPVIYENGGKVLVGTKVKQIILDESQKVVIGVQMNDREQTIIKAKNVICACSYFNIIENCLPLQFQENPEYKNLKQQTSLSAAPLFVFIGLKGTKEELQLPLSAPTFDSLDYKFAAESVDDLLNANCLAYASFHSARIKDWNLRFPNKSAGEVVCYHQNDLFDKWKDLTTNKRGEEYEDLKKKIGEAMLEKHLYPNFPQLRGKVDYMEVATSLTTQHYLNAQGGTAYGIKENKAKYDDRIQDYLNFQANNVTGLWFCGQDIIGGLKICYLMFFQRDYSHAYLVFIFLFIKYFYRWNFNCQFYLRVFHSSGIFDLITGRSLFKDFPNLLKHLKKQEIVEKKQN